MLSILSASTFFPMFFYCLVRQFCLKARLLGGSTSSEGLKARFFVSPTAPDGLKTRLLEFPSTPEGLKAGLFELPPNPEGLKARHLAPRRWAHACLDVFIIKFYLMTHNTRCIEINIFCLRLQRYNILSRFASLLPYFIDETPYFPDEPPHFYVFLNIVCLQTTKRGAQSFISPCAPIIFLREPHSVPITMLPYSRMIFTRATTSATSTLPSLFTSAASLLMPAVMPEM